ncbi:MAG: tRNA (adenosine(37)-N6)-threonylcarbamoyltransferase complex ATPase subunit type 1 TsaE [Rudaea sp.]|uniref:tRNA (adenosine(37)-N6)-threonylcarbamoyltransferase complex ATPase subunit type 1 TsaE n=1 Tax=unclassified Rudaea TaxID=2627037 RepID=UPI0010F62291|nr:MULTISPECIES: tRNA (adenosine(37)-N6)-threonylcarbamoyltransferase complex ATPase subunit type 1 TsaE [unclassified Rudaea]MBN8886730.1 tRNA (adenosine(37)-N6)-threonylcarbamoyltransferase complex ATPase subunit type 1 TsaE [Rudaea sp.]MBR0345835.1 tRNA (adenosine(37)-N6)-threonylcarbamoyltransferase complex ATPase subunit type 1 TsaE [Rudaea sp.]
MTAQHELELNETELVALARRLADRVADGGVIYLEGDLGVGKTTFARALLGALGVGARIKSPTYSLIESYEANGLLIHHLDLYRIAAPDELEFLGLSDLAAGRFLLLAEWPERGGDALPVPDLVVHLAHAGERRRLHFDSRTARGGAWAGILSGEMRA